MNKKYEDLRSKAFSALNQLSKQNSDYEQMRMIVGAADSEASLKQREIRKSIDVDWITRVEEALPALDIIIRDPRVAIEDQEEVVPVELTRVISEKSIKHLAQHTNLIREINGDEITPSRILNVFHEETYLTYENKFVNTLLARLSAFVDKRYRALVGGSGVERDYQFDYGVDFEHFSEDKKRTSAKVKLHIELTSPTLGEEGDNTCADLNSQFSSALERLERINQAISAYISSPFAQKLGRNYIRPPVIRTNAILKNKNFKDCLTLWEYIEGYDKLGFSVSGDEFAEKPSDSYVSDMYSLTALQYTQFFHGVVEESVDILAQKQLSETDPDFSRDLNEEELDEYLVYDSEYKKVVPVSRLMDNRKKLSDDERRIREAIEIALRADEILNAELLRAEEEERRLERERIAAEKERLARIAAMEEAARRGPVTVSYKRSYLSRYIQAGEQLQSNYNAIKNELLSYKRTNSRISWKCETFKQGRNSVARINVKGKSLYLYLALHYSDYEDSTYISDAAGKYSDTSLLIKIKSPRSLKRALSLVSEMMSKLNAERFDRTPEDYSMPYESTEELIERGLVKMILPDGVILNEFDEIVKADMSSVFGDLKKNSSKEQIAEETVEEISDEEQISEAEVSDEEFSQEELIQDVNVSLQINGRYRRSYLSRYIQAGEQLQSSYNAIKNELLSYKRINSRISWKYETFKQGRANLARINVKGKTLYLYLALSSADYAEATYVSDAESKYSDTSLLVKVKSSRSLKKAMALIADMMSKLGAERTDRVPEDYSMPYESTEELVERGLIKMNMPFDQEQETNEGNDAFDGSSDVETNVADGDEEIVGEDITCADDDITQKNEVFDPSENVVIDITEIDLNDAEFSHAVTMDMIDELGVTKQVVVIEKKIYLMRTCYTLSIIPVSKDSLKKMKIVEKNFVFKDSGNDIGVVVPYTKEEYYSLSARDKKKLIQLLTSKKERDVLCLQLAALRILKSSDSKIIEKLKKLEARLEALDEGKFSGIKNIFRRNKNAK